MAREPLVEVQSLDPRIQVELKYATPDNFMGEVLYPPQAKCYLRQSVAERLVRIQQRLSAQGYDLLIYDGYRPLAVQKKMFARFPQPGYVADPVKGSNHNRGAAVDLTIVDAKGSPLAMPSEYDEFSERAHRDYMGGTDAQRRHRWILQDAMVAEGFKPLSTEWWHFDDARAKEYPVLDVPFHQIDRET